jgi:hypothetical protein
VSLRGMERVVRDSLRERVSGGLFEGVCTGPCVQDKKFWEKVAAIVVLSFTLGVLAFGGIVATNFTSANWCQVCNLLTLNPKP